MTKKKIYDQITDKEAEELERMVDQIISERNRLIKMDKNWLVGKWPKIFTFRNVKKYPLTHLFDELFHDFDKDKRLTLRSRYSNIIRKDPTKMQKNDDYFRIVNALKNELNGQDI